jgi:hypothetical protein
MSTYWGIFYFIIMAQKKFTYLMKNTRDGQYKIGESNYPKFREKTLMSQEPVIEIFACFKSEKCNEKVLHKQFANKRGRGEWFILDDNDLEYIKNNIGEFTPFDEESYKIELEIDQTTIKSKINLLYKSKEKIIKNKKNDIIKETHREIYHIDGISYGWGYVRASGFGKFTKGFCKLDLNYFDFITSDYSIQNERFFNFYDNFLKPDKMYPYHLLRVLLFSALMSEVLTDKVINSDIFIKHPLANCDGNPERYIYGKRFWALNH